MAESEYDGRVRVQWPSPNAMAESEYDGRVILEWPCPNGLAESEWSGRIRVVWPSPNELPNHPGRVRLAGRVRMNYQIRVNFGRVDLAESKWALTGSLWPSPTEMAE